MILAVRRDYLVVIVTLSAQGGETSLDICLLVPRRKYDSYPRRILERFSQFRCGQGIFPEQEEGAQVALYPYAENDEHQYFHLLTIVTRWLP